MSIDAETHLRAVQRSVSSAERDGQPAIAVTLSRGFETTVEDLWDAVTNAERIPRWAMPVTGDLRLGGRYQLEGNAGGTITVCEQRSHFALTWEFAGDVSWVEAQVSAEGVGGARFTVGHIQRHSEHWDTFGPGATGVGWEMAFLGLALHIAQPDEPMPDEMAFVTSAEGRALITGSSEAWGWAAVDAGADAEAADEAARRTAAFYTGEPGEPA